jgi:hypothetical protein
VVEGTLDVRLTVTGGRDSEEARECRRDAGPGCRPVGGVVPVPGHVNAERSTVTLAVVDAALAYAEELEGLVDVGELLELWQLAHL